MSKRVGMPGMKTCSRCGLWYRSNAIVCPACYDILPGGQIVLRKQKPVEQKPLAQVHEGSRVRFPANYGKTRWYHGTVLTIREGGQEARVDVDDDRVRIVSLNVCEVVCEIKE